MTTVVAFDEVSTAGLESSPVAEALAGLRANEARYYKNRFGHTFAVVPASEAKEIVDWVHRILKQERDIVISRSAWLVTSSVTAVGTSRRLTLVA